MYMRLYEYEPALNQQRSFIQCPKKQWNAISQGGTYKHQSKNITNKNRKNRQRSERNLFHRTFTETREYYFHFMDAVEHPKPLSVLPCALGIGPVRVQSPTSWISHSEPFSGAAKMIPNRRRIQETRRAHLWSHTLWLGYSAERHSLCAGQLSYGRCLCFNTGEH